MDRKGEGLRVVGGGTGGGEGVRMVIYRQRQRDREGDIMKHVDTVNLGKYVEQ